MSEEIKKNVDIGSIRALQTRYETMRKIKDLQQLVEQYKSELQALKNRALQLDTNFDKIIQGNRDDIRSNETMKGRTTQGFEGTKSEDEIKNRRGKV